MAGVEGESFVFLIHLFDLRLHYLTYIIIPLLVVAVEVLAEVDRSRQGCVPALDRCGTRTEWQRPWLPRSMKAAVVAEAAAKGYGNSRSQDRIYDMFFQSYFFFLLVQFTTLLLFSAVMAAVEVSTFWLRRFGRCSHGRAATAIVDAANGRKRRPILLFYFCSSHFLPLVYLVSVGMDVDCGGGGPVRV